MNNQQKRGEKTEESAAVSPVVESVATEGAPKGKRGRPKISPHDSATQTRLRVQRYRDAKREGEEVAVEVYLPKEHGYPADVTVKPTPVKDA